MAASSRQSYLSILAITALLTFVVASSASPVNIPRPLTPGDLVRRGATITYDDFGNIANVTDPSTHAPILQGAATDGSGVDFNASAIIWLVISFVSGVPLMLVGVRLWRLTTGIGIGLACTVCLWASFANTTNAKGIADLIITLISLGSFVLGFAIGVFELGYAAGITMIALLGGFSIGARIVLFRSDLLVHKFFGNWLIITGCGLLGFLLLLVKQRAAITICSAAAGTFMTALGVDLIVNRQSGMSFGLRYLFDRNTSHYEYLFSRGWHPPISSIIIMAISLALIPPLAYGQHRIFSSPFKRVRTTSVSSLTSFESRSASNETAGSHLTAEKNAPKSTESTPTVELNSVHERATPTPNPSINSLAKLLPQKPK